MTRALYHGLSASQAPRVPRGGGSALDGCLLGKGSLLCVWG